MPIVALAYFTTRGIIMTAPYKHLTREQRYQISALIKIGLSPSRIAKEINCNRSTISRELKRNTGKRGYRPKQADKLAQQRKRGGNVQISEFEWAYISHLIEREWSPEQIHGFLELRGYGKTASVESIYQFIYADKQRGGRLHKYLRCQKQRRKRYGACNDRRGQIVNRVGIEQRPVQADMRQRYGDFEGDTVIGAHHKGALLTLVDRHTNLTIIRALPSKNSTVLAQHTIAALENCNAHTITFDNGKEFAQHQYIANSIGVDIYFADPYASWQRGTNENTNGLIRQYFPKNQPLDNVTMEQVIAVQDKLNNRPRKKHGYLSPLEVLSKCHSVALRI